MVPPRSPAGEGKGSELQDADGKESFLRDSLSLHHVEEKNPFTQPGDWYRWSGPVSELGGRAALEKQTGVERPQKTD